MAATSSSDNFVHQEADRLEYDDKLKILRLFGHVKLWQKDSVLVCDHAVYYLKTQEATAGGHLKMTNPNGTLTGDNLHVFYKEKIAIVIGDVILVYQPKGEKKRGGKIVTDAPITMTSNELHYDWGKKVATAQGNVLLQQKGRKAWGDSAVFEEIPEQLTMDGHVKLLRPPKDTLLCDHLVYQLKSDDALATGHVVGNFWVKQKAAARRKKSAEKEKPRKKPAAAKSYFPPASRKSLQPSSIARSDFPPQPAPAPPSHAPSVSLSGSHQSPPQPLQAAPAKGDVPR